ncbi:MAG: glycosyltransferase family 2 protein [Bacilli bacterium]|nr:glycosyltransferase family 2 protein [Bacilli bacterium]
MIDIIIPLYNSRKYLVNLLDSLLNQTYQKFYIILVDANSKESYNDILINYQYKLKIKYFKLNKKYPPSMARNYAIKQSNHKYIMFIDHDDTLINNDAINVLINNINEYDVISSSEYYEANKKYIINDISLHGKLYKRKFIIDNNINFSNLKYHEDTYFNNLIIIYNAKIKKIDIPTYYYHDNSNSITNKTANIEFDKLEYLIKIISIIKKKIPTNKNNINNYKKIIFENYNYFKILFGTFNKNQKQIFANLIYKYDKEDAPLMLSKNSNELKQKIDNIYNFIN